jgi:hypothetical protein
MSMTTTSSTNVSIISNIFSTPGLYFNGACMQIIGVSHVKRLYMVNLKEGLKVTEGHILVQYFRHHTWQVPQ